MTGPTCPLCLNRMAYAAAFDRFGAAIDGVSTYPMRASEYQELARVARMRMDISHKMGLQLIHDGHMGTCAPA